MSGLLKLRLSFFLVIFILIIPGCVYMSGSIFPRPREIFEEKVGGKGGAKVLVLDISGVIKEQGFRGFGRSEAGTVEWVRANLDRAREDKKVKALILRVDSPGGFVTACDIVHSELKSFKRDRKIPVVAVLMSAAASGGYYVATAADRIVAHPTTATGSIGVIYHGISLEGLMDKVGVEEKAIKTGEKKDMGSIFRGMTDKEKEVIQGIVNSHFQRFLEVIREGRKGISDETLKNVSDGRVLTAEEALRLGLVDEIGYLENAIEAAKKMANLKKARVVIYRGSAAALKTIYTKGVGAEAETGEGFMYF